MRDNGIRDTINTLIDTDPTCLDRAEVRDTMALVRHVRGWADAALLSCSRRLEQLAAQENSPFPSHDAAAELTDSMDQPPRDSNSIVDQTGVCNTNTGLEDSLAAGEITSNHIALIARYRNKLSLVEQSDFNLEIDRLRELAKTQNLKAFESTLKAVVDKIRLAHQPDDDGEAELERQRRNSHVKTWVDQASGLHKIQLVLDPLRAAKFTSAMNAELAALRNNKQQKHEPFGSLQIDAIINAMSGGQAAARSTELVVIVDHQTLTGGRHEHSVCETLDGDRVPVPTVQRLCETAIINLFATNNTGNICDAIGERTANRAQRRALAALYRTCAFPECDAPFSQTRMHHIQYASRGGETKLSNLIPICETHHGYIHNHGWTLTIDEESRCATFTPPARDRTITTHPDRKPATAQPSRAGP